MAMQLTQATAVTVIFEVFLPTGRRYLTLVWNYKAESEISLLLAKIQDNMRPALSN